MNPEYVYCLKNEEMPNICKCGGTADSPYNRCDQLSNTSLPVKCEVAYFVEVSDWKKAEKYIHNKLNELGIKRFKGKEWFKCKPDDIKSVFDECKKLFEFSKDNNGGKDSIVEKEEIKVCIKNKKNIKDKTECQNIKTNIKKYYCDLCNYETFDRSNYSRHKNQLKHIEKIKSTNNIDLIKKENIEQKIKLEIYEKEIFTLKNELFKKDLEIFKLNNIK